MSRFKDNRWTIVQDFCIDHNELEGVSPEKAFILGVEFMQCAIMAKTSYRWKRTIHAENSPRIILMLKEAGHSFSHYFLHEDVSESWVRLVVKSKKEREDEERRNKERHG